MFRYNYEALFLPWLIFQVLPLFLQSWIILWHYSFFLSFKF